jgi:hypothetical protein
VFTNTHKSCDSFSLNTGSNKYSFLSSNIVIRTAIHGEGEKVNFRQKIWWDVKLVWLLIFKNVTMKWLEFNVYVFFMSIYFCLCHTCATKWTYSVKRLRMCEIVCGRKSTCMAQTKIYRHKKDINIELQQLFLPHHGWQYGWQCYWTGNYIY